MLDIEYNDIRASNLKVMVKELPEIPAAQRAYETINASGSGKTYLRDLGNYENVNLPITFNYIGPEEKWHERWIEIQKWLSQTNGELIMSDNPEYYLKVQRIILGNNVRKSKRVGEFQATFVLKDGLFYLKTGKEEHDIKDVKWNPGEECYPLYHIKGTGLCNLNVNGKDFEVTVTDEVTIDAERGLTYSGQKEILNNAAKGDYASLILKKNQNIIKATKGFKIKITPNWRCI